MFEVAGAPATGPPGVLYGWGPWQTFQRLLAAEEDIDLSTMVDFGGTHSWDDAVTVLRPLFDLDRLRTAPDPTTMAGAAERARQIHARWAAGHFADDPGPRWMRELQVDSLGRLIALIDHCARIGARMTIH